MHIETEHIARDADSPLVPRTLPNGSVVESIRVLIAVEFFGEGSALLKALEAAHYAPDYLMVLNNDYFASALTAETWDVVLCNGDATNFSVREMLSLAQACDAKRAKKVLDTPNATTSATMTETALLNSPPPTLFFVLSNTLSAESTIDLIKAGATDVIRRGNSERLCNSLRRELAQIRQHSRTDTSLAEAVGQDDDKFVPKEQSADNTVPTWHGNRDNNEHFRYLVQHSRDIISILDESWCIVYQSPAFYRLFHYREEDVIGLPALNIVHPDDKEIIADALRMSAASPDTQITATFRARTAEGKYRTIESIATNRLANPTIRAIIVNSRDISDRTGMEGALRESEQQYRTLVENLSEGIIITDKDDKFIFVNPAAEQTFGVELGQLLGQTIEPFIKPETKA
ncbi:MAG: PAS domain-containing protein, partial [Candidatus Kapabacteria bacterium]|nr:PAS domain-containing protein [Candidatus Kapabacteria bacterium]